MPAKQSVKVTEFTKYGQGVPCFRRGYSNRVSFVNYFHLQTPSSCYSWKYNSPSAG